jgi:hypothetical protein
VNDTAISPPLASVVYLKVHEIARRPVLEQARLRAQLEAIVAVAIAELAPEERIVLDASDGAAVAVFRNPLKALQIGERALPAAAVGLQLRIGINHGAVELAAHGGGHNALTGDGVATAAQAAHFASPASLLMTRSFRDALADASPALEVSLRPAGVFTDAGLRSHELFSPDKGAVARRRKRFLAIGAAAVIVFIGIGVSVRFAMADREQYFDRLFAKAGIPLGDYRKALRRPIGKSRP